MLLSTLIPSLFKRKKAKPQAVEIVIGEGVGTPLASVEQVLSPHSKLIEHTERVSGFAGEIGGYSFDNLFTRVINNYVSYIHLLPASSGWHHSRAGGLVTHSLEVANRALRIAKQAHLPANQMIDIEIKRKPRWEYATWLAGLLHDSGKVFTDLDVVCANNRETKWHPLVCDIYEWANRCKVDRYYVEWRAGRKHKAHENTSLSLLQTILTPEAKLFISECPDDLHSALSSCLTGYSHNDGFMQDAVRRADSISTSMDIKQVWDKNLGPREAELFEQVIMAMKDLADEWLTESKIKILNSELFIEWPTCIDRIIEKLSAVKKTHLTASSLLSHLVERGIIRGLDNEKYAQFYENVIDKQECLDILIDNSKADFVNYVRVEWPYHVLDCRPIPKNNFGLFKTDVQGNAFIFSRSDIVGITSIDVIEHQKATEEKTKKPEKKSPAETNSQSKKTEQIKQTEKQEKAEKTVKSKPSNKKTKKGKESDEIPQTLSFSPNDSVVENSNNEDALVAGISEDEKESQRLILELHKSKGAIAPSEGKYYIIESVALSIWNESRWALLNECGYLGTYHLDELSIVSKNNVNGNMVRSVLLNKEKYLELTSDTEDETTPTKTNEEIKTTRDEVEVPEEISMSFLIENSMTETDIENTTTDNPSSHSEVETTQAENTSSDNANKDCENTSYEQQMSFDGIQYLELEITKKLEQDSRDVEFEDVEYLIDKCLKNNAASREDNVITVFYSQAAELLESDNQSMKDAFIVLPKLGKWNTKNQTITLG